MSMNGVFPLCILGIISLIDIMTWLDMSSYSHLLLVHHSNPCNMLFAKVKLLLPVTFALKYLFFCLYSLVQENTIQNRVNIGPIILVREKTMDSSGPESTSRICYLSPALWCLNCLIVTVHLFLHGLNRL